MNANFVAGLASGLALTVAIGAQNAFVLRQGIRREHLLPIVVICSTADAFLISVGIGGVGLILQQHAEIIVFARQAGALFLLAYAAHAFRRAWVGQQALSANGEGASLGVAILSCLGFTFLNPHVYLDTVILLGTLGNQHGPDGRWLFCMGAVSGSVLWFFSLAYGARLLTPLFRRPAAWRVLDSLVALTLLTMAVGLLADS